MKRGQHLLSKDSGWGTTLEALHVSNHFILTIIQWGIHFSKILPINKDKRYISLHGFPITMFPITSKPSTTVDMREVSGGNSLAFQAGFAFCSRVWPWAYYPSSTCLPFHSCKTGRVRRMECAPWFVTGLNTWMLVKNVNRLQRQTSIWCKNPLV